MTRMILGARGGIKDPEDAVERIQAWSRAHHSDILAADARLVFGKDHLESAVRHAERAQATNTMRARALPAETLLYLSGQRQVVDAIRMAGLQEGTEEIAVVLWADEGADDFLKELGWTRDDAVLDASGKSLEVLGISEAEQGTVPTAAVADLALEKVALLDIAK